MMMKRDGATVAASPEDIAWELVKMVCRRKQQIYSDRVDMLKGIVASISFAATLGVLATVPNVGALADVVKLICLHDGGNADEKYNWYLYVDKDKLTITIDDRRSKNKKTYLNNVDSRYVRSDETEFTFGEETDYVFDGKKFHTG